MNALYGLAFVFPTLSLASHAVTRVAKSSDKVVIGYVLDEADKPLVPEHIDYAKITHLNISFCNPAGPDGNLSITPRFEQLLALAKKNKIKVLVSIGGGLASTTESERNLYFDLISDAKRNSFVDRIVKFIDKYQLDGVDVDLEGPAVDKDYGAFVSDLSEALKPKGKLLTAAVSRWFGGEQMPDSCLGRFDFINVMAYDATGPWAPEKPGQHSSIDFAKECTAYWIGRGVAKSKLVLGVPFYGYGFGNSFNQGGYTYAEIVNRYPGAETSDQVGSTIWYNGIPTIRAKVKYAVDQGLGGVMIWSVDQDAKGKASLLGAIHDALETSNR